MKITVFRAMPAIISLSIAMHVKAQTGDADISGDRPRVGLALGGGGARGAAHIGVLRELERLRIPIDASAGTSMCAVVGGLYASGRTPDEVQQLIESRAGDEAFNDQSNREKRRYRPQREEAAFSDP